MPRLAAPSLFASPPQTGLYFASPTASTAATARTGLGRVGGGMIQSTSPSSIRLTCSSPDGRSIHSLVISDRIAYIETHSLPLAGTTEDKSGGNDDEDYDDDDDDGPNGNIPSLVRTRLPETIQTSLSLYPAIELLCVDVDSIPSYRRQGDIRKLPLLCLYTQRDVYLLELAYRQDEFDYGSMDGVVLSAKEPFDSIFLGSSSSIEIIRIRPSPQRRFGHATMCPPGSLALLMFDSMTNEYTLALHHGDGNVGRPLSFSTEQLEESDEKITDFCFAQSTDLSLLSSLSVLLLKGSGDVMLASPILFDGAVVARKMVSETVDYINAELEESEKMSAKWRQYRASRQFLVDSFPLDAGNAYVTANLLSTASSWPVQIQGPVLLSAETDDFETVAVAVESVKAASLIGIAIAHQGETVDYGIIPPTVTMPRFMLESDEDRINLDEDTKFGSIIQRVDIGNDDSPHQSILSKVTLLPDPVMENVMHYISQKDVKSISTNIIEYTVKALQEEVAPATGFTSPSMTASKRSKITAPKTTAWSCLNISNMGDESVAIVGAVVSGDQHLGHTLVARLSDGSLTPVNLTESRHHHEMQALDDASGKQLALAGDSSADVALRTIQNTPPLHQELGPIFEKISTGLNRLGKIVGSSTPSQDITPELLAVAMNVKKRCNEELYLPLIELKTVVDSRQKDLRVMLDNQRKQLSDLRDILLKLKDGIRAIQEKSSVVEENAKILVQRSSSALQSSKDLLPSITQAEYRYFNELKLLTAKCETWKKEYGVVHSMVEDLRDGIDDGKLSSTVKLPSETIDHVKKCLEGNETKLQTYKNKIDDAEDKVELLSMRTGLDLSSDDEFLDAR